MAEDTAAQEGRDSVSLQPRAGNKEDRYDALLDELRVGSLKITWRDKVKVSGLLYNAKLNPDNYSLEGDAETLWSNLIAALKARGELAQVLRVVEPDVGVSRQEIARELADHFEEHGRKITQEREYNRMVTRLMSDVHDALEELGEAPDHLTTLNMPGHPSAPRIAGMRNWIVRCVRAVGKARTSGSQVSRADQAAQVEEIATQLAAVSDAFHLYESSLRRFRRANDAEPGQPPRPLATVVEEERLLLSLRTSLRSSIQQLIAVLPPEQ